MSLTVVGCRSVWHNSARKRDELLMERVSVYYSTQVPRVAVQEFDDEVLLANFETGVYYSLTGSAAAIWLGLKSGATVEEIAAAFTAFEAQNNLPTAEVVRNFVEKLLTEKIIAPSPGVPDRQPWHPQSSTSFSLPVLDRFDDLRDLLLLDPVHDVSQAGWPRPMKARDGS
jgi:hypothetical protein